MINICLLGMFLIGIGCSKEESKSSQVNLVGTWIEKNPEMFDGISDTIVFTKDYTISKHFYFNNWKYIISNDSVSFKKDNSFKNFKFSSISENEVVFYNFLDRSITEQVKDIHFIKIK